MGPISISTFHRPVIILVVNGIVPATSCGPLVHSSACILCVALMACLSPLLDAGHSKYFRLTDLLDYQNHEFHEMPGLQMLQIRKVTTDFGHNAKEHKIN